MLRSPLCRFATKILRSPSSSAIASQQQRSYLWRPWWWGSDVHPAASDPFSRMERHFREVERDFERFWASPRLGFFDLTPPRPAAELERFHLEQPIVEEGGAKKFKLVFDVSHFKPDEINIKTSGRKLSISAKHESKEKSRLAKYEYQREFDLPDGVKAEEVTCKYTNDGQLAIEAPYKPPAVEATEQEIAVKHE